MGDPGFLSKHGGREASGQYGLRSRDHLLLDLFTMPFVEPYLISEPLSTAGRVNLNYQIAPYGYIKRSTALRAALHPLRVTAVKTNLLNTYKVRPKRQTCWRRIRIIPALRSTGMRRWRRLMISLTNTKPTPTAASLSPPRRSVSGSCIRRAPAAKSDIYRAGL